MIFRTANEPNCLIALFLRKTDIIFSTCKRLVINDTFEPVWIRSPGANYWIYSLSTPQRVTVQCKEVGSPPTYMSNSQLLLEGTGILPNSSSCYVYADSFKLLPHSLGRTEITLNKAHIVFPIIENMLKVSEEVVLQSDLVSTINLQRLDEISTRVTSRTQIQGTDVTKLVNMLQDAKEQQQPTSWLWFGSIVFISALIGSLWPVWIRLVKYCYFSLRKNKTTRN